jgi:predicted nucleic acid-binding protein
MIILDTNVLSEPLRAQADGTVAAWLDAQDFETLYLTSVTLAEVLTGLEILPLGQRRSALEARLIAALSQFPPERILPFDTAAARFSALLMARAKAAGQAIGFADGQIAAIAGANGFAVATRDVAPFVAAGVAVVNPWE